MSLEHEFERQLNRLLKKNYPEAASISREEFLGHVEPLRSSLKQITFREIDIKKGYLPFVLVVKSELVPTEKAMSLVEKDGMEGVVKLFPHEAKDFQVIENETVPDEMAYLLVDIDRGKDTINIPPHEALRLIRKANRSPLTIDEGVAIVTQFPEFLIKNNCFSLLASRHSGDQRVPAIWINSQKNPNLGWCWDGNPHTWLGSASCNSRIGIAEK
jgi:hypothetical protein